MIDVYETHYCVSLDVFLRLLEAEDGDFINITCLNFCTLMYLVW
jgi:hypothetical protein